MNPAPLILAADTSTNINTVALCLGEDVLVETLADSRRLHAERLLPTVDWILREAGVALEEIDLLAISAGPGSFTGLRIGVATWKGLAFGAGLPTMAVPTLDALARAAAWEGLVCPVLDARMQEVFTAQYRLGPGGREKVMEDRVCSVSALLEGLSGKVYFLGDGLGLYGGMIRERLPEAVLAPAYLGAPRAALVAAEAYALWQQGVPADAATLAPVYLRKSQAEVNRKRAGDS